MRHLVTPPTILFFISCHLLLGCSEERTSFVPSNEGCAGHATCGPGQVCIAASCKELCSDEHGCSLNDICIGGLCEDGHCGDGVKVQVEECDLGADNANDGLCLLDCTLNQCGDGFVYVGHEECDDGNLIDGDGCNASCERTTPQTVDESAPAHEPESESSLSADSTCEIGPPESSDTEPEPEASGSPSPVVCNEITDCEGNCIAEQHTSLIGDGFCDDHTGLINFNCNAFDFDGGDCSQDSSSIEEVESPRDLGVKPTVEFIWSIVPDFYQDEIAWEIYTYDGLFSLYTGNPTNSPLTQGIALEKGSYCFSVYDSFGDGGSSGQLFIDGVLWNTWGSTDYSSIHTMCFEVSFRECPSPQVEDCLGQCVHEASLVYLGDGICDNGDRSPANFNCAAFHWDFVDCL